MAYADASGDHNPIHASPAAAAAAGLPDVVAHGMLTMALTGALASAWAGDPAAVVEHGARFTGLVPVPEHGVDVEVAAVLAAVDEAAGTVRLDLSRHLRRGQGARARAGHGAPGLTTARLG